MKKAAFFLCVVGLIIVARTVLWPAFLLMVMWHLPDIHWMAWVLCVLHLIVYEMEQGARIIKNMEAALSSQGVKVEP